MTTHDLERRVAAAPISWGVSEVAGWGRQMSVHDVLSQMSELGFTATELGPDGFLSEDPASKAETLASYGLAAVAQFVPVVLHDPAMDPLPQVERALDGILACGATTVVLAAATGQAGYDARPALDEAAWTCLLANLDRITASSSARGVVATLHPHVGTMIETAAEVQRVIDGSSMGLCLDTGHLLIGGVDPVALAREHAGRVTHVHLKDVRAALAERVRGGEVSYSSAVAQGLYAPLGEGDVDVAAIVESLEEQGYRGWYVLEQDTVLPAEGVVDPRADVRSSRDYLVALGDEGRVS